MSIFDELARAYEHVDRQDLPGTARYADREDRSGSRAANGTVTTATGYGTADLVRWAWDESPSTGRREQARIVAELASFLTDSIRRRLKGTKGHGSVNLEVQLSTR